MDNDHIGGIADFPQAAVHVGVEEFDSFNSGNPRYLKLPMAHQPAIKTYAEKPMRWYGFEARKIDIEHQKLKFTSSLFLAMQQDIVVLAVKQKISGYFTLQMLII